MIELTPERVAEIAGVRSLTDILTPRTAGDEIVIGPWFVVSGFELGITVLVGVAVLWGIYRVSVYFVARVGRLR